MNISKSSYGLPLVLSHERKSSAVLMEQSKEIAFFRTNYTFLIVVGKEK